MYHPSPDSGHRILSASATGSTPPAIRAAVYSLRSVTQGQPQWPQYTIDAFIDAIIRIRRELAGFPHSGHRTARSHGFCSIFFSASIPIKKRADLSIKNRSARFSY